MAGRQPVCESKEAGRGRELWEWHLDLWGRSSGGEAYLSPGVDLWDQVERRKRPEWRRGSGGLWVGVRMPDWEAADLVCS